MRRAVARAGILVTAVAAVVAVFAAPAAAHITVDPTSAPQGGLATIAFRVPNEEDSATTVKLEVNLPTDAPVASVSVRPVVGWTAVTATIKLAAPITNDDGEQVSEAVSKITWTASASQAIKPGQFQEFEVSLGPLPKTNQMVFKTIQTYSNGDIVRWIDLPNPGGQEPEHPAPVLTLTTADQSAAPAAAAAQGSSSNSGFVLGLVGLIAGVAALVVGVLAYRKAS